MNKPAIKSKTIMITGIGGILTAVGAYLTGDMDMGTAIQTGLLALTGIFLRLGGK